MQTFSSNRFLICSPGGGPYLLYPPLVYVSVIMFCSSSPFFSLRRIGRERERIDAGFHLLVDYKHNYGTTFTANLTGILQMVIHSWNVIFFGEGISLMQFFHAFICLGGGGELHKNVYVQCIYTSDSEIPFFAPPPPPLCHEPCVLSYMHINKIIA